MGNADSDTIVENTLDCPIFAKGIRIIPLESAKHIALRFDVSGCYIDNTVIGKSHHDVVKLFTNEIVDIFNL